MPDPSAGLRPAAVWRSPLVLAAVGLHLAVAVPLGLALNIWRDEAYTLYTTSSGLADALDRAIKLEMQPPFYFMALSAWRHLESSPAFARLFSALCTSACLLAAAALSRRALPGLHPAWLTLVLAVNPFVVWAATEVRNYALVLLLSALVMLVFPGAFLAPERRPARVAAYAALSLAALYTQYYTGFLLTANAVVLLLKRRRQAVRDYVVAMAVVAVLFVPILGRIPEQVEGHTVDETPSTSLVGNADTVLEVAEEAVLPLMGFLDHGGEAAHVARNLIRLAFGILLILAVTRVAAVRAYLRTDVGIWLKSGAVATGLQCVALLFLVGPSAGGKRHMAVLLVPSATAALALAAAVPGRRVLAAWTLLATAGSIPALVQDFTPLAKPGDVRRVARHLAERQQPGEPIFVYPAEYALPLRVYYSGPNPVVPLPSEPSLEDYDLRMFVIHGPEQLLEPMRSHPAGRRGRAWLVIEPLLGDAGVSYGLDVLERYVRERYDVEERTDFHRGTRVLYLRER